MTTTSPNRASRASPNRPDRALRRAPGRPPPEIPDLDETQCLALFEAGATRHPIDRALLLAASAGGDRDAEAWADVPLGTRDAHLMALRCAWFGPRFEATVACPACRQTLTVSLDLAVLAAGPQTDVGTDAVRVAGARYRLPTSRDLAAVAALEDLDAAAGTLLRRVALDGQPVDGWGPDDVEAIERALDEADPLAHVTVGVRCDSCAHAWPTPLDIAASLWADVASVADAVASQVHQLASAYGWGERDILAMSAARRALYLRQVAA